MRSTRPRYVTSQIVNVRYWRGLRRMGRGNYAMFFAGVWSGYVAVMFGIQAYMLRDRLWDGPFPLLYLVVGAMGPFLGLLLWELYEGAYQRALRRDEGARETPSAAARAPADR
ncbi:MAG: hypothetical protein GC161_00640 [Planctomycetaceae bacterium]|nr:hypothetical protein [Planctomycetaceae bacterium]